MSTPAEGYQGELRTKGGLLRAVVVPGEGRNRILSVRFSGDFKTQPEGTVQRLEQALAGTLLDEAPARIEDFFAQNPGAITGMEPGEFLTVLSLAYMKVRRTISSAPDPTAWKKDQA